MGFDPTFVGTPTSDRLCMSSVMAKAGLACFLDFSQNKSCQTKRVSKYHELPPQVAPERSTATAWKTPSTAVSKGWQKPTGSVQREARGRLDASFWQQGKHYKQCPLHMTSLIQSHAYIYIYNRCIYTWTLQQDPTGASW